MFLMFFCLSLAFFEHSEEMYSEALSILALYSFDFLCFWQMSSNSAARLLYSDYPGNDIYFHPSNNRSLWLVAAVYLQNLIFWTWYSISLDPWRWNSMFWGASLYIFFLWRKKKKVLSINSTFLGMKSAIFCLWIAKDCHAYAFMSERGSNMVEGK